MDPHLRTVVVAGDSADPQVVAAAAARQIPVVAEPSSGACAAPTWVPHAPFIIPRLASSVQQVVVTGNPSLSRPVARLLGEPQLRKIVVSRGVPWVDVTGTAAVIIEGITDTRPASFGGARRAYLTRWLDAAENAERVVGRELGLNLFSVCRAVWQAPGEDILWLGASNTVRGFELAAGLPGRGDVFSNRGLAGIDGTIASAAGAAAASGRPLRAVMGDLTFTADLSTLAQQLERSPNLQLVVLDDGGGSIFASLEHGAARFAPLYERYFAAASRLNGPNVANACGWDATEVTDEEGFLRALDEPIRGRSLLWVKIPRPKSLIATAGEQLR